MNVHETAEWILNTMAETAGPKTDLEAAADLLAQHVLALEDGELMTALPTSRVTEFAQQNRRYLMLLEQINAADEEARGLLERSLDYEIERRQG